MLLGMAVISAQAVPPPRINIHLAQDGFQLELKEITSEIGYRLQKATALQDAHWSDIAVIQSPESEYALWVEHVEDVVFFRAVSTGNGAANALVLDALAGRPADDRVLRRETNGAISGAFSSGPFLVELPGKIPPDGMGGQRLSFLVSGAYLTFDLPYGGGHEAVTLHPVDLVLSVDANNLSDIRIDAATWSGDATVTVAGAPFILTDLGSISVGSDGVMRGEIELSKYGGDPVEIQPGVWLTGCTGTATAVGIEPARLKVDFSRLSGAGLAIVNAEGRQVAECVFTPLGSQAGTLYFEPFHLPVGETNGITVTNMQAHVCVSPGEPVPMKVNHVSTEIQIDPFEAWPRTALTLDSNTREFSAAMLDAFVYEKTEADPGPWSVSCELQPLSAVLSSSNVAFDFNGASLGLTHGPSALQLSVEPDEPDLLTLALKGLLHLDRFITEEGTNWPAMLLDLGANGLGLLYNSSSNQWDWSPFSLAAALDNIEVDIIGDPLAKTITLTGSGSLMTNFSEYAVSLVISNFSYSLNTDPDSLDLETGLGSIQMDLTMSRESGETVLRAGLTVSPEEEGYLYIESFDTISIINEASGIGLKIDAIALHYDFAEEALLACSGSIAVTGHDPTSSITATWSMNVANQVMGSVGGRISITESDTCWLAITPFGFSHDDWQGFQWLGNPGASASFTGETGRVAMSLDYDVATEAATLRAAAALDIQTDDGLDIKTTLNELVVDVTTDETLCALNLETEISHAIGTCFIRAIKEPDASVLDLFGTVEMDTAEAENGIAFNIQNGTFSAVLGEAGLRNVVQTGVFSIRINGVQYGLLDFSR